MFFRTAHLQFDATPERLDPVFAKMLQEALGGQRGEISVMMTYLLQGWECWGPAKYKDMIMDHSDRGDRPYRDARHHDRAASGKVAPRGAGGRSQELAGRCRAGGANLQDAIIAGMNPQHAIVSDSGATPSHSVGCPWNAKYRIPSGNLLADFRFNVTARAKVGSR